MPDQPTTSHSQHRTVGAWLFHDLNAKTLFIAVVGVCTWYYGTQGKISVGEERDRGIVAKMDEQGIKFEQQIDATNKRHDTLLSTVQTLRETTLRTDTYNRDQGRLDRTITELGERILNNEKTLTDRNFRK